MEEYKLTDSAGEEIKPGTPLYDKVVKKIQNDYEEKEKMKEEWENLKSMPMSQWSARLPVEDIVYPDMKIDGIEVQRGDGIYVGIPGSDYDVEKGYIEKIAENIEWRSISELPIVDYQVPWHQQVIAERDTKIAELEGILAEITKATILIIGECDIAINHTAKGILTNPFQVANLVKIIRVDTQQYIQDLIDGHNKSKKG